MVLATIGHHRSPISILPTSLPPFAILPRIGLYRLSLVDPSIKPTIALSAAIMRFLDLIWSWYHLPLIIIALPFPSCLLPCLPLPFCQELAFIDPVWLDSSTKLPIAPTAAIPWHASSLACSIHLDRPSSTTTTDFIYCRAFRRSAFLDSLCAANPAIHASWLHLCMLGLLFYRPLQAFCLLSSPPTFCLCFLWRYSRHFAHGMLYAAHPSLPTNSHVLFSAYLPCPWPYKPTRLSRPRRPPIAVMHTAAGNPSNL